MSVFNNEVGRPSNKTIKKRNRLKIICVILVLLITGLLVYILCDKGVISVNNKIDKKDNKNVTTTTMQEKITLEEVKKIYNTVFDTDFDSSNFDSDNILYLNSEEYKTATALLKLMNENVFQKKYNSYELLKDKLKREGNDYIYYFEDGTTVVFEESKALVYSYDDVKKRLEKIYGSDSKLYEKDFDYYQYKIINIPEEKIFVVLQSVWGDGGHIVLKTMYNPVKTRKEVSFNLLIIDAAFVGNQDCYSEFIANDGNTTICLSESELENEEEVLTKYKDNVHEFKYVFKENNDGSYYFDKVEKIK